MMTVKELRTKLEGIDPQAKVMVKWEVNGVITYFDALDASLRKVIPSRVEGIAGFTFGGDGSLPRLFIDVAEA